MEGRTYDDFRSIVKKELADLLAVWKLSDEQLEKYMRQEEDQIKGAYDGYLNPRDNDKRADEVRFNIDASTVAYCLYMCF